MLQSFGCLKVSNLFGVVAGVDEAEDEAGGDLPGDLCGALGEAAALPRRILCVKKHVVDTIVDVLLLLATVVIGVLRSPNHQY